jgi:hypothetical protein
MGLGVVDKTLNNGAIGHFLKTKGLGADLEFIVIKLPPMTAFIFHRVNLPLLGFDQVRFAN